MAIETGIFDFANVNFMSSLPHLAPAALKAKGRVFWLHLVGVICYHACSMNILHQVFAKLFKQTLRTMMDLSQNLEAGVIGSTGGRSGGGGRKRREIENAPPANERHGIR